MYRPVDRIGISIALSPMSGFGDRRAKLGYIMTGPGKLMAGSRRRLKTIKSRPSIERIGMFYYPMMAWWSSDYAYDFMNRFNTSSPRDVQMYEGRRRIR